MFFNKSKKMHSGDILKRQYLEEISDKTIFLHKIQKDLLHKTKQILRNKNINCTNVTNFKEVADEVNKYSFNKIERRSRFDGNVIDLRDEVRDGEILLMVKTGERLQFYVNTFDGSKVTVEWLLNGKTQKSIINSGTTFNQVAPSAGESSVDKTFSYVIYRIYSSGPIKKFAVPTSNSIGNGMSWIVSKNIHFDELILNGYDYTGTSYAPQHLEYIDLLDGGTKYIRANACSNLTEVEAEYINIMPHSPCKWIFNNCKKLQKLPVNCRLSGYNFSGAFQNCGQLVELPEIDLSYSIDNSHAFSGCTSLTYFKDNVLKVNKNSNCSYIASGCTALLELPDIIYGDEELGEGNNWSYAFQNCSAATKMSPSLNLSYCTLGVSYMFSGCANVIDGPSEILLYNNLSDNLQYSTNNMFYNCSSLRSITGTITSTNVSSCANMFRGCKSLKKAPKCMFTNTLSCDNMYEGCSTLVTPPEIIDYPKAITSTYMFAECNLLQSAPTTINLNNCLNTSYMFNNCKSMIDGPININIAASLNNTYMFNNCSNLINFGQEEQDITFNQYANNSNMFINCSNLKTVGNIKGGQNFSSMFSSSGLEKHPAINTLSNAVNFDSMFNKTYITTLDLSKIDAPNVYSMSSMFAYCPIEGDYVIDLSKYSKGIFFNYMFRESKISNATITFPTNAINATQIFMNCYDLKTIVFNIPSASAYFDNPINNCNYLQSLEINGNHKIMNAISNFTSTFLKKLIINSPNWELHSNSTYKFNPFTTLETCDMTININNYVEINGNKKLTDINLVFNCDEGLKNNAILFFDNNAFEADVLNKIMTALPDMNAIDKDYEYLTAEITIKNNPGTASCDTSIATNKGWIVYTS